MSCRPVLRSIWGKNLIIGAGCGGDPDRVRLLIVEYFLNLSQIIGEIDPVLPLFGRKSFLDHVVEKGAQYTMGVTFL